MKQLDEIVELAVEDDARLVTILRKCLVVAARLRNTSLRDWATAELNGYNNHLKMPNYRIIGVTAKGFFVGPFGAQLNDQPLPPVILKKEHRRLATTAHLVESISAYEAMVIGDKKDVSAMIDLPSDLVYYYQAKFIRGYALNRAWQEIPIGAIVSVVDTVRTRLLQFALDLQGEIGTDDNVILPPELVERSVQTFIYGGVNVVGSVTGNVQLIGHQLVVQGDFGSLETALKAIGVEGEKIHELEQAIEADRSAGVQKGVGSRVADWLKKAGTYVGTEGLKAGVEIAQKTVTQSVLSYFGLPS